MTGKDIDMANRATGLTASICELEAELADKDAELKRIRKDCRHEWSEPAYVPEYHKAYTIPADGKGSDWRPSCSVPPMTIKKWTRHCQICGLAQVTGRTHMVQARGLGVPVVAGTSPVMVVGMFHIECDSDEDAERISDIAGKAGGSLRSESEGLWSGFCVFEIE